jgi:hypothetical protein
VGSWICENPSPGFGGWLRSWKVPASHVISQRHYLSSSWSRRPPCTAMQIPRLVVIVSSLFNYIGAQPFPPAPPFCNGPDGPQNGNLCNPSTEMSCCVNTTTFAGCQGSVFGNGGAECGGLNAWLLQRCTTSCFWDVGPTIPNGEWGCE